MNTHHYCSELFQICWKLPSYECQRLGQDLTFILCNFRSCHWINGSSQNIVSEQLYRRTHLKRDDCSPPGGHGEVEGGIT